MNIVSAAILFLGKHPREILAHGQRELCVRIFIAALFVTE